MALPRHREGMRLPLLPDLPGPRDVQRLVEQLIDAVPRMTGLLGAAEALVADTGALLARIERTRATADELLARTEVTRAGAEELLARTEVTRAAAEQAVVDIDAPFQRMLGLLDALEGPLLRLQPTLERLAETTHPAEVDAAVAMIDQLPTLSHRMETEIMPVLKSLGTVAPDMHDLLDITREVNELLSKVPGMGRIRKRVEEQQAEEGLADGAPG